MSIVDTFTYGGVVPATKAAPLVNPVEPYGFRPSGSVAAAYILKEPPPKSLRGGSKTVAQKSGKRYERKCLARLVEFFPIFLSGPWIEFYTQDSQRRLCQPDGIVLTDELAIIVECKIAHTIYSWWQLRHLYEPVVQVLYPERSIRVMEMTRWMDPSVGWPEQIELITRLDEVEKLTKFGVLQWKG